MQIDSAFDNQDNILTDIVVSKYKDAADICNIALSLILKKCVPGASIADVCEFGDKEIQVRTAMVHKQSERGIAFPTSICLNNTVQNHVPSLNADPVRLLLTSRLHFKPETLPRLRLVYTLMDMLQLLLTL